MLAGRALREAGEVLEAFGARDHVDDAGFLDRLAGVAGLELGELVVARAQDVGGAAQDAGAFRPGQRGPRGLRRARGARPRPRSRRDRPPGRSPSRSPVAGLTETRRSPVAVMISRALRGPQSCRDSQFCETIAGCHKVLLCERCGDTNMPRIPLWNDHSLAGRAGQARRERLGPAPRAGRPAFVRPVRRPGGRRGGARVLPDRALLGHRLDRRHGDDRPREPPRCASSATSPRSRCCPCR